MFCIVLLLGVFGLISALSMPVTGPVGAAGAGAGLAGAWLAMTLGTLLAGIWILYRIFRGWMALRDGKAMHG